EEPPAFLEVEWLLAQFSAQPKQAQGAYRRFVAQGGRGEIWQELKGGVVLGGEDFVKRLEPLLRERRPAQEIPRRERLVTKPSLEELFAGVKGKEDRDARIYRAVVVYGYRLAEVGDELGLHYSTVSRIVGKGRRLISKVKT
ncbi:MAG TPA: addiction module toxin RelE, partial [Caldilineae bacterium]|nr:addiction module toxin RelE [Caldilineae bacterium]